MFPSFDQAAAGGLELWAGQQLAARLDRPDDESPALYSAWASSRGVLSEKARDAKNQRLTSDRMRDVLFGGKAQTPSEMYPPPSSLPELCQWLDQWAGSQLDPLADLVGVADEQNALRRYVRARDEHESHLRAATSSTGAAKRSALASAAAAARERDELHDPAALFVAALAAAWESNDRPQYKQPQQQAVPAGKW